MAATLLLLFVLLNVLACMQARAMTRFAVSGEPLQALPERPWPARWWALLTGVEVARPANSRTPAALGLPYETQLISLPQGQQLEAWWVAHPRSRGIVLLLPGYAQPKDSLLGPAAEFYAMGYSSMLLDFRGAGGSSGDDTTLGMREAEDVLAAAAQLRQRWPEQPLVLYGVSMGATAALRAVASGELRPAGMILEGPFDRLSTALRERFAGMGLPAFPAAELLLLWGSLQMGYNGFEHNPAEYASQVDAPVLLLYGERDPWVKPAAIEAIARGLRGRSSMVVVPGLGHEMPFALGAPALWRERVGTFMQGL